MAEVGEYNLLERLDLVLKGHEVRYCLVSAGESMDHDNSEAGVHLPFIWIVDALQCDIFLILEETIKLGTKTMETELGHEKLDIGADEGTIAYALRRQPSPSKKVSSTPPFAPS